MKFFGVVFFLCFLLWGCGSDNVAADQAEQTPEQKAREHMNADEFTEAIAILEPLVEEEPDEHSRKPLLSAAYAGLVGVSVFDIVTNQFSNSDEEGSDGDSVFTQVDAFLPTDYEQEEVETMNSSVQTLESIPVDLRGDEGDPDFGSSAEFQLQLYQTVYSTMYLNLFVVVDASGDIDLDTLSEMTEEDATAILEALAGAADGSSENGLSESVSEALTEIEGAEGETDAEKLQNYLQQSQ